MGCGFFFTILLAGNNKVSAFFRLKKNNKFNNAAFAASLQNFLNFTVVNGLVVTIITNNIGQGVKFVRVKGIFIVTFTAKKKQRKGTSCSCYFKV